MKEQRINKEDRRQNKKDGKIKIWVKEETLLYEEELKRLQLGKQTLSDNINFHL